MTPTATARARAGVAPAPLRRPIAPRRVSGPVRHPRAAPLGAPLQRGHALTRVLDAPFLDRLIRGRAWIALVAFALLGIVAMQVTILRLGASIGRSVTQIEQLTQQNETAATKIAALEPGRTVAAKAASLGMVYPPDDTIQYLRYNADDASEAAATITAPTFAPPSANPGLTSPLTASSASTTTTDASTSANSTNTANAPTTTASTDTTDPSSTTQTNQTTTPTTNGDATPTVPGNSTTGAVVQTTAGAGVVPGAGSPTTSAQGGSSAPGSGAAG